MIMKRSILISFLIVISMNVFNQENMVTLSGGYSFANINETEFKGSGWRINGLYEFNKSDSRFAHGISFGYINLSSTENVGSEYIKSIVNSFPLYYAPKIMSGGEKFKVFIKGAIGLQFAALKKEGFISLNDHDFGFYGGAGAGLIFFIKENIFINAEYELAWASNSWYHDGWINTAGGGIGFKF
jgi:hypothetical protein